MFIDELSGKNRNRSEALLDYLPKGDTVIVHSMEQLARNFDDLRQLVRTLTDGGVRGGVRQGQSDLLR
ncbi:recombinase family protein [Nocardia niigatensis]